MTKNRLQSTYADFSAKTRLLQERWGANAGRTVVRPPAPHFPASKRFEKRLKREDDGREGAISGRLARKATGVSPSGFALICVLAEKLPSVNQGVGRETVARKRKVESPSGRGKRSSTVPSSVGVEGVTVGGAARGCVPSRLCGAMA